LAVDARKWKATGLCGGKVVVVVDRLGIRIKRI
jgi:hypothetical protein